MMAATVSTPPLRISAGRSPASPSITRTAGRRWRRAAASAGSAPPHRSARAGPGLEQGGGDRAGPGAEFDDGARDPEVEFGRHCPAERATAGPYRADAGRRLHISTGRAPRRARGDRAGRHGGAENAGDHACRWGCLGHWRRDGRPAQPTRRIVTEQRRPHFSPETGRSAGVATRT
jgi:hypothetical protein